MKSHLETLILSEVSFRDINSQSLFEKIIHLSVVIRVSKVHFKYAQIKSIIVVKEITVMAYNRCYQSEKQSRLSEFSGYVICQHSFCGETIIVFKQNASLIQPLYYMYSYCSRCDGGFSSSFIHTIWKNVSQLWQKQTESHSYQKPSSSLLGFRMDQALFSFRNYKFSCTRYSAATLALFLLRAFLYIHVHRLVSKPV